MSTHIQEYERILEDELNSYRVLEDKIQAKKEYLIKRDIEKLSSVDNEILTSVSTLNKTIKKRREISKLLGGENLTLKEIIEKAQNDNQRRNLAHKRESLQKSAKNIERLNIVNAELIKQSLLFVEKSVLNIAKAVAPETKGYNSSGKTNNTSTYRASSIVKEA